MPQIFPRWFDSIARAGLLGAAFGLPGLGLLLAGFYRSDYATAARSELQQPVPFSHEHHAGQLGIDCRYCHTAVESSAFAGIPPTETCMHCHQQIWVGAATLAPVRESWRNNVPIHWTRIHNLPGYVYFNHGIHVAKGVGCVECHGRVDQMPLTWQAEPLSMEWCLTCHRDPARHLRPRREVTNMAWHPSDEIDPATGKPANAVSLGRRIQAEYHVKDAYDLTRCSICHR